MGGSESRFAGATLKNFFLQNSPLTPKQSYIYF
uniref:Uncharacterized protein n=1 Tax=virus sp. ctoYX9 TaxID=2825822 RepID=A0A8S5RPD3_9VIRU|nr:MAG TPA: hypothetical protein [virus sp. ctoYX9]